MMWNTRRNAHSAPGASVQQVFINLGSYGEPFSRLPSPHHGCDPFDSRGLAPGHPVRFEQRRSYCDERGGARDRPAQNPKLVTAARWKPRRKVGESCDPTWLCQQHKHIRCEHGVCTIYHSHNKKCGTRGYKCKNWLMCMNGKCRRRRDWWRSRWPGYVCLPLSRILERMLETSIFKTSSIGPVPMLNPCPFS